MDCLSPGFSVHGILQASEYINCVLIYYFYNYFYNMIVHIVLKNNTWR